MSNLRTRNNITENSEGDFADIGMLVGNGLNLNYDQRLKNFMQLQDDSEIGIAQVSWYAQ